ncbi:hypothetical protein SOVF_091600 [Spinacia oleracea]|uniref:Anthranilate N-benzoyltransferase protein 2-like n=1 Tax=Spinacia oleracea TaxID=3562 RepID=A0A9R0ISN2_SPIOL|nr:anthranilate N-benzoyltransferase protein 2-like [Spinacia oleracea]XP_021854862.1 anthranilate N-benzoyltransferase protein 2-like [Spinacia oleracea]KNA16162.1 hypothetical protein SOVF_091600 [Spinacia oleracea]
MSMIKVKETTIVCPAEDTPKESIWLSRLDMIGSPYSHLNVMFVFPNISNAPDFFDSNVVKEALSKILVPFYPLAGRLKVNNESGRREIDCNGKGVVFIEAETTIMPLVIDDDFGEKYMSPDSEIGKDLFPKCDYSSAREDLSLLPLLFVQLTRFECGGVCLGFAHHHHFSDGASFFHFVNEWARLAKGLDVAIYPVHDRATYLAPRHPPQVNFRHLEYEPSIPPLIPKPVTGDVVKEIECVLKISKEQIDALKLEATSEGVLSYKPSTFEVLSGHVWRTACKARGLADDQDVKLIIPTNGRSRLKDPALPQGYCGNVMFFSICVEKAENVIRKPLWYVANKIHEAIKRYDDIEYVRSNIDYVESHLDLAVLAATIRGRNSFTCPNLSINSWARLPCYEADFGWGGPELTTASRIQSEGKSYITSSSNGDGSFSVFIKLFTPHMALFKDYLYDF